jgi:phage virion morphogenesis protein
MRIVAKLDAGEVKKTLGNMLSRLGDKRPALRIVGEILRTSFSKNFEEGGRPAQWKPSRRAVREGGQTLVKTGRLVNSIFSETDASRAVVGTNVKYAAIQQLGAKIGARVILPVKGKALFWPGARHPVKKVNWPGATIPARPFLVIQDEDWAEIRDALWKHITAGK